ncbi:MAG: ATP-binding protein [Bacillota bacterium]
MFNTMPEGAVLSKIVVDKNGKPVDYITLEVNSVWEQLVGLKREQSVGRRITEVIPGIEKDPSDPIGYFCKVALSGQPKNLEFYCAPFQKYDQISVFSPKPGYFIVVFFETTERKKSELALQEAQTRLLDYASNLERTVEERTKEIRDREQQYHDLYESFGEAFIATDWELNVIHWNKAAERVTTVKGADALGKKIYQVLPEMTSVNIEPYLEVLQNKKPVRFMMSTISRETNKPSIFEISTYPSVQGIIVIVEDKTEEEQTKRLSAIGATAGMVGHDIRNPLQAMVSDVYLLRDELASLPARKVKEGVAESLESIEKNINYINKIVADLQDYARPLKPELVDVNLHDLIANVFQPIAVPDNIVCLVAVNQNFHLKTDPTFVRRILSNLIVNAIQAMPEGGRLSISGCLKEDRVLINIEDTGVGIPNDVKPKIFNPMMTTKAKGQGLGLAVVKRLIESLNGNVTFESAERKGTKFKIELPVIQ